MKIDLPNILFNLLLIPQNYYMKFPQYTIYIPPAYALALEVQFFIIFPFITKSKAIELLTMISLIVAAYAQTSYLNTDWWGYRLLPGTLCIFLLGSLLYKSQQTNKYFITIFVYTYFLVMLVISYMIGNINVPQTFPVCFGVIVGFPIIQLLSKIKRNKFDEILGNASYGIFLCHYTVIWFVDKLIFPQGITNAALYRFYVFAISVFVAYFVYYLFERPWSDVRRKIRKLE